MKMIRVLAVMDKAKREDRLRELVDAVFTAAKNYKGKLSEIYDDDRDTRFVKKMLCFAANDDEEVLIKIAVASISADATAKFFGDKKRPVRVFIGADSDEVITGFFPPVGEETEWVTLFACYPTPWEEGELKEALIEELLED